MKIRSREKRVGLLRIIAMFMIVVLITGGIPLDTYADDGGTPADHTHEMGEWVEVVLPTLDTSGYDERSCLGCNYIEQRTIYKLEPMNIYFYNFNGESDVESIASYFYATNTTTGKKYYFEKHEYSEGKWQLISYVPREFKYIVQTTQGVELDRSEKIQGSALYHYALYWVHLMDGEEEIDTIYSWTTPDDGYIWESSMPIPQKGGYEFDGWIHENGNKVLYPVHPYYTDGWNGYHLNLYASWIEHDHDYTGRTEVSKEPTCQEKGIERTYCVKDGCESYIEAELDVVSHQYKTEWSYDSEHHYHVCKFCGIHERDIAHEFTGNEVIIDEPTCAKQGLKNIYCAEIGCGAYISVPIMETEHIYCSEWEYDGEAHYRICEVCGKRSDEHSHNMSDGVVVREATAEEDGIMEWECVDCGYTITGPIKYVEEQKPNDEDIKPEIEEEQEEEPPLLNNEEPSKEPDLPEKEEPKEEKAPYTGDASSIKMYATLAMIAGFTYLLCMFPADTFGMSKEEKEHVIKKLIKWAKGRHIIIRWIAIALMFFVLTYYYAVGRKIDTNSRDLAKSVN